MKKTVLHGIYGVLALLAIAAILFWFGGHRLLSRMGIGDRSASAPSSSREGPLRFEWAAAGIAQTPGGVRNDLDGIAIDAQGNVYISGVFNGTTEIAGRALTSRGEGDVFAAKFDDAGTLLWLQQFGGPGDDNTYDVDAGPDGTVVLNGWFAQTAQFGEKTLASQGGQDQFILKLNGGGDILWLKDFGGTSDDGGNEVIVADDGSIYATGESSGTFRAGDFAHDVRGTSDSFVIKLTPAGDVVWMRSTEGSALEHIRAIGLDSGGNVYAGYEMRGRGDFSVGGASFPSRGGLEGGMAKWSPDGTFLWAKRVGGKGQENVRGITGGPDGTVYVTGMYDEGAEILGTEMEDTEGRDDTYIALLDPAGAVQWMLTLGSRAAEGGGEIESDDRGIAYFSTDFSGETSAKLNGVEIDRFGFPASVSGNSTALLLQIGADGQIHSRIAPDLSSAAGGQTLGVKPDGTMIATSMAFLKTIGYAEETFTAQTDSKNFLLGVFRNE